MIIDKMAKVYFVWKGLGIRSFLYAHVRDNCKFIDFGRREIRKSLKRDIALGLDIKSEAIIPERIEGYEDWIEYCDEHWVCKKEGVVFL